METTTLKQKAVDIINELPDEKIYEVVMFARFISSYDENGNSSSGSSYKRAVENWRKNSDSVFESEDDREFMQHAFDSVRSKELYSAKEIWQ